MSSIQPPVQLAAVVLAGLVAGLLLAFRCRCDARARQGRRPDVRLDDAVNIPLNDALASTTDILAAHAAFEQTWVLANNARVLTAIGGCACLAWVLRISA